MALRRASAGHRFSTNIWPGFVDALATLLMVLVFALIIGLTEPGDGVIRIVNQVMKVAAIFLGVRAIVPRGAENGVRRGALLGLLYMGVGVLAYALLSGQKLSVMGYAIDVLMGLAAGGLSGMLLSSLPEKK